jgi:hypothetical protein
MPAMTEKELLGIVDAEFSSSMGAPGGEISSERAKAWSYYLSRKFGNEVEGESSVVTSDVSDVVDGIMPSLLRLFTTADNLVSFDPVGPEDIEGAEQESDFVNYVFFKRNPAFMILYTWFFDALVQKNGIVKAWWDDSERVTRESYKGLSAPELAELMDDEELEAIEQDEREVEMDAQTAMSAGFLNEVNEAARGFDPSLGKSLKVNVTVHDVTSSAPRNAGEQGRRTCPLKNSAYRLMRER